MPYIINKNTEALVPMGNHTKILEKNKMFIIKDIPVNIIADNCILNGSTLEGRQKGSGSLLGSNYKPPIIINNSKEIILIPTHSSRNKSCVWINLSAIAYYRKNIKNKTIIEFLNKEKIEIDISFNIFDKQVLRATRLESAIRGRNNQNFL